MVVGEKEGEREKEEKEESGRRVGMEDCCGSL
jgi:hypothetical protein